MRTCPRRDSVLMFSQADRYFLEQLKIYVADDEVTRRKPYEGRIIAPDGSRRMNSRFASREEALAFCQAYREPPDCIEVHVHIDENEIQARKS
jgi:hypothetical protein